MSQTWSLVLGGCISGGVGGFVALLTQFVIRQRESRAARTERLGKLIAASWALSPRIGAIAFASMAEKQAVHDGATHRDAGDDFNALLAEVQLTESTGVLALVLALDEELIRASRKARERVYSREDWRAERRPIGVAVRNLLLEARKSLGSPNLDVQALPARSIFRE